MLDYKLLVYILSTRPLNLLYPKIALQVFIYDIILPLMNVNIEVVTNTVAIHHKFYEEMQFKQITQIIIIIDLTYRTVLGGRFMGNRIQG